MDVPPAKVFMVPVPSKYGILPVATVSQLCPVPPLVVPMAVAFQVPVPMVPKVVMEVVPVLASKAMVPNPKVVLAVEASESSIKDRPKAVNDVVE